MRLRRYVPRIIIGLVTLVAGCFSYSWGAYYGGRFEAYVDLTRDRHSIRTYGARRSTHDIYEQILAREYSIEVVRVAGCIVSEQLVEKTRGYNETMEASIEKRHGLGILEKLWRRANSEYKVTP
jgi:hypothetical protein